MIWVVFALGPPVRSLFSTSSVSARALPPRLRTLANAVAVAAVAPPPRPRARRTWPYLPALAPGAAASPPHARAGCSSSASLRRRWASQPRLLALTPGAEALPPRARVGCRGSSSLRPRWASEPCLPAPASAAIALPPSARSDGTAPPPRTLTPGTGALLPPCSGRRRPWQSSGDARGREEEEQGAEPAGRSRAARTEGPPVHAANRVTTPRGRAGRRRRAGCRASLELRRGRSPRGAMAAGPCSSARVRRWRRQGAGAAPPSLSAPGPLLERAGRGEADAATARQGPGGGGRGLAWPGRAWRRRSGRSRSGGRARVASPRWARTAVLLSLPATAARGRGHGAASPRRLLCSPARSRFSSSVGGGSTAASIFPSLRRPRARPSPPPPLPVWCSPLHLRRPRRRSSSKHARRPQRPGGPARARLLAVGQLRRAEATGRAARGQARAPAGVRAGGGGRSAAAMAGRSGWVRRERRLGGADAGIEDAAGWCGRQQV